MRFRNHGGGCCGIVHLIGFDTDSDTIKTRFEHLKGLCTTDEDGDLIWHDNGAECDGQLLIECVLTDNQLTANNNEKALLLKELGFVFKSRFLNPNSGNVCNVFHHYPRTNRAEHPRTWPW